MESKMLGGVQSSDEDRNKASQVKKAFNALIDHSISFGEEDIASVDKLNENAQPKLKFKTGSIDSRLLKGERSSCQSPKSPTTRNATSNADSGKNIGVSSQFEKRLGRFGKFNEQDKERLLQIFIETKDDPEWFAESVFFDLYQKRIPINEFLQMISSDPLWTHMATSKQQTQLKALFDKVYGYTKSLSRREEQNKRYQKRLKQIQCKHDKDKGKGMLNELFEVNKFMSDKDLLERYAAHLNKVMMIGKSKFMMERYHIWTSQDIQESKQLNFYERMRIDDMVRRNKKRATEVVDKPPAIQAKKNTKRSETTKDSLLISDQSDNSEEDEEKRERAAQELERKQRVQQLQSTLRITEEQATEIERMTRVKGLQKKIGVSKEQEELSMSPYNGQQMRENAELIANISNEDTKIYFPNRGAKFGDDEDQKVALLQELKLAENEQDGRVFTLKNMKTLPGKYMLDQIDDEKFNQEIVQA